MITLIKGVNLRQFQLPPLTKTNKWLIISMTVIFFTDAVLGLAFKSSLAPILGLSWVGQVSGYFFQWATYAFLPEGLWQLVFDGLLLWFLGAELEMLLGRRAYLGLIFASILSGGIIYLAFQRLFFISLLNYPLLGPGVFANAILVLYALYFPDRQLYLYLFPVAAKYFCLLLIGIQLYSGIFTPFGVGAWGPLGGMLAPAIWWFWPARWKLNLMSKGKNQAKRSGKLSLVKGGEEEKPGDGPRYWH